MKKLLLLLFLFPLMAQSINDTDEAKKEHREMIKHKEQMRQERMWKQKDNHRQVQVEEMMMRMKMHDRKMVNQHKHHLNKFNNKNYKHQIHSKKKRMILGSIVIFSLGYVIGNDDMDNRNRYQNKHHRKERTSRGVK